MSNRHEIWYGTGKVVVYIYVGFDVCARRVDNYSVQNTAHGPVRVLTRIFKSKRFLSPFISFG